jgi:hypothetical protein
LAASGFLEVQKRRLENMPKKAGILQVYCYLCRDNNINFKANRYLQILCNRKSCQLLHIATTKETATYHRINFLATIMLSLQVKLLIPDNAFCIVHRATAQSKTGFFRDCGVAEAPPRF